eukprot:m.123988 g.123988  ORF g.123988 m.123988 type:complete len:598 (-) comp29031_c0_seq1:23-1816(-)
MLLQCYTKVLLLLTIFSAVVSSTHSQSADVFISKELIEEHLQLNLDPAASWPEKRSSVINAVSRWAQKQMVEQPIKTEKADDKYGFFRWLPQYMLSVNVTDGQMMKWTNKCFKNNTVSATMSADGSATLSFDFSEKDSASKCSDTYIVATIDSIAIVTLETVVGMKGTHTLHWEATSTVGAQRDAVTWDLTAKGIRVFRLLTDKEQAVKDIAKTAGLFMSELVNPVPAATAKANMEFLSTYTPFPMSERTVGPVPFDPSEIRSGDFFGIVRLDGLDPMLAWAMGSTTGHTTVALWDRSGSNDLLMVCESTANDVYWPTNGVQCTPYTKWIEQATKAGYNIVLLPLDDTASAAFDEAKAWAWMESVLGLNYGYQVMFWSWIDTVKDNYPCTAPDFKDTDNSTCLTWELIEILTPLLDKFIPPLQFGQTFIKEALAHRVGISAEHWNSSAAIIYQQAAKLGFDMKSVPTMVEQDEWRYHITKNGVPVDDGQAMVCCVFVCNMWKSAGVFANIDSDFNCGELTNLDAYSAQIFKQQSPTSRPAKCMQADPTNPNCQIMGNFTLRLNRVNSKPAFKHMDESCPSLPGCANGFECPDQPPQC